MLKRAAIVFLSVLLVVGFLSSVFTIHKVKADTITVPDDYPTIQEAINHANGGDTVFVRSGTYYENVVVSIALSLVGENRSTTTIDGGRIGNVLGIVVDNVNVTGFTVQNSGSTWPHDFCVDLTSRRNCRIEKCVIKNGGYLVYLAYAHNNTVRNNIITNASSYAIYVYGHATNNTIANNTVTASTYGVEIEEYCEDNVISYNNISLNDYYGIYLLHSNSNFVANNLLSFNGFINPGLVYPGITLMYSSNNTMAHNTIYNNTGGILVRFDHDSLPARYNIIESNIIANSSYGLILHYGGNQSNPSTGTFSQIHENTLKNNGYSIELIGVDNNTFCHNNILGSINKQVDTRNSTNAWDNGIEGNFWSNYTGVDNAQDGIGDTPYVIDTDNADNCPLMGVFYSFTVWVPTFPTGGFEHVNIISNSTVSSLDLFTWLSSPNEYLQPGQLFIEFSVTGDDNTTGFCRMTLPRHVLNATSYVVVVNWQSVDVTMLPLSNSTHDYLYFAYNHSTQEVIVTIPEFSPSPIALLSTMLTFLVVITYRRRLKTP